MSAPIDRLSLLRERGAEAFDPEGLGLAASLLARAEALGGAAGERLAARAVERIDRIEAALRTARAAVEREIAQLAAAGAPLGEDVTAALARGEITAVKRAVRLARRALAESRAHVEVPWAVRLHGEALARGARLPAEVARDLDHLAARGGAVARTAHAHAVALGSTVSTALYRESAESARAAVAVARAADNLPASAGPYNGQVLAARALAAMAELSPAYARAVVSAVDDLAAAEARLAPEPAKPKAKPAKKRRAPAK